MELYYLIVKKEAKLFDLVWDTQRCDSWEDIFRDYSYHILQDKADGVADAIECIDIDIKNELYENEQKNEQKN